MTPSSPFLLNAIMGNGAVKKIVFQNKSESGAAQNLLEFDQKMGIIRENLRAGYEITQELVSANFA